MTSRRTRGNMEWISGPGSQSLARSAERSVELSQRPPVPKSPALASTPVTVTIEGAALLLGVSTRTVRRWVADGLLTATPDTRGRAKLYPMRAVYEAEYAARTGVSTSSRCGNAEGVSQ